jgi:glycosyltransferase involved in cell wall biosynthesis
VIGPSKNGGIGTAMTGLGEYLASTGGPVTVLFTGSIREPHIRLSAWTAHYASRGIELVALTIGDLRSLAGPVRDHGFGTPYLVYQYLATRHFDIVHFNDYLGDGSICVAAKKLGLAFRDTLLAVALHGPTQWVHEHNGTAPEILLHSTQAGAERLSVAGADVLWSPSQYLIDWARQHGFRPPAHTFVQPYCIPAPPVSLQPEIGGAVTEVVFFGRLEERKGLPAFCDAIELLKEALADRRIAVTFLGRAGSCGGTTGPAYAAARAEHWRFPVRTITNLGQPEALAYLSVAGRLAVMASPSDNSPCTVYEVLALGLPFLAARGGGVPELIAAADQDRVLFDATPQGLCDALRHSLDHGATGAAPAETQHDIRKVWLSFHGESDAFLTPPPAPVIAPPVIAIVDGGSTVDRDATLRSLAQVRSIQHVIVLDRTPADRDVLAAHQSDTQAGDHAILLIHAGVRVRPEAFEQMLSALYTSEVDGLQPAAEVEHRRRSRVVQPLGGDPIFALFEGPTFTGGLLLRGAAFSRATRDCVVSVDGAFLDLAECCVTPALNIWPYPAPVLERSRQWTAPAARPAPSRLEALRKAPPGNWFAREATALVGDRHRPMPGRARWALALIDLGFVPLVRLASWGRQYFGAV